jgi:hypothetical protein
MNAAPQPPPVPRKPGESEIGACASSHCEQSNCAPDRDLANGFEATACLQACFRADLTVTNFQPPADGRMIIQPHALGDEEGRIAHALRAEQLAEAPPAERPPSV